MALDPGILAILQARRNYATRGPVAAGPVINPVDTGPGDTGPVIQPPVPVPPVAASPEAKSLARASRMRNYMQANGMTPMTYGRFNVRRGNLPIGSGLPGGAQSSLASYSGPPIPGMPISNNSSNTNPTTWPQGQPQPIPGFGGI